ncbi:MAG: SOS response-associated peptidase [Anaerolineae bacterium]|nr:SOS response-associated peptidase [Anaerolineae bacterium]
MCGRFVLAVNPEQLTLEFGLERASEIASNYNVAPTQNVLAITNEEPDAAVALRWGLVPSWAKDLSIGAKMINARAETISEKPAFRTAFKRRRCLIPANGFYEWHKNEDGTKTPMYIHLSDREIFAFAGLWEVRRSDAGEVLRTCTIITTNANTFMESIHDRMPVILHRDDYAAWLTPGDADPGLLKSLLLPYDAEAMTAYPVSKAVNRAGYSSPELIQPLAS